MGRRQATLLQRSVGWKCWLRGLTRVPRLVRRAVVAGAGAALTLSGTELRCSQRCRCCLMCA